MGNKVNANALRLGISKTWDSRWFFSNSKLFRQSLLQDIKIRKLLMNRYQPAGLTQVEIERSLSGMNLILHSVRPGMIIGRGGKGLEEVKEKVMELLGIIKQKDKEKFKLEIKVEQVKKPFLNARYVADYICERIARGFPHRGLVHSTMSKVKESGSQGVKVVLAGRIRGANIARVEKYQVGKVPLSSVKADIDYASSPSLTRNGYVGIKVWICR
jgi:small subunit ribosomal protein S3